MKILVTGGAGFIGSHVLDALLHRGHTVRVLDNFVAGSRDNLPLQLEKIELLEADLAEDGVAHEACKNIDAIFHFAAIPGVQRSIEVPLATQRNGEVATVHLLNAAITAGVKRLIFASSCSVYGAAETVPVSEEARLAPMSPYAASKIACEAYLSAASRCSALETVSLRYFNVYGPRQDPSSPYSGVISLFLKQMLAGKSVGTFGDGEQTRDFVFVSDVAQASLLALQSRDHFRGDVFNIGTGRRQSINQVIATLGELLGRTFNPSREAARSGDITHSEAKIEKAQSALGYHPAVSLREGLRHCLAAASANPI